MSNFMFFEIYSIRSSKPQPRKDYKLNIRKILSTHEAVAGMTLEGLYSRLSKKFGPLTDTNKTHIQTALSALEEAKEIFLLACDTNNPKFRLVNHPEFKGYPQEWKLNLTDKKTFKPRKTVDTDEDKMFAFHITCACGHYHVQYIAE